MDVAPISINTESIKAELECNMPTFGTQEFILYKPNNEWFLQYMNYPVVRVSVGADLYDGISNIPYKIKILPTKGFTETLNATNITNFYIGMIAK